MIATNAFKQAVSGTYTAADTVIELNSISDTVGNADYLPNGGFNLILYDGLFGNPADANNAGKYEILECTGVNYATNEVTVVREVENTTAVTIDASSWQVVYGATVEFFDQFEDADATILKQANVVDTLVSTSVIAPLSANQGKELQDNKEPADATILKQADVVDTLVSTSAIAPLSANQGKQLQDTKIATSAIINDLVTGGATKVLSAEQGVEAKALIDGKEPADATILKQADIINDLTTGGATKVLSAEQGVEAKSLIDGKVAKAGDTMTGDLLFTGTRTVKTTTADPLILGTNNTERMRIDANGLRIIGGENTQNSVANLLDLEHKGTGTSGYESVIRMGRPTTANRRVLLRAVGNFNNFTNPYFAIDTNEFEALRINHLRNIGIGTISPTEKLHVVGNIALSGAARSIGTSTAHDLILKTNNTERGRITSEGDMLVSNNLTVSGHTNLNSMLTESFSINVSASAYETIFTLSRGCIFVFIGEPVNNRQKKVFVLAKGGAAVNGTASELVANGGVVAIEMRWLSSGEVQARDSSGGSRNLRGNYMYRGL